jgi:hypothetical protein
VELAFDRRGTARTIRITAASTLSLPAGVQDFLDEVGKDFIVITVTTVTTGAKETRIATLA